MLTHLTINWSDPETWWLNMTNIVLGIVVLVCVVAVAFGIFQEITGRMRRRAAQNDVDRELRDLLAGYTGGHALDVRGLGLTMADGGKPIENKKDGRSPF